MRTLSTVAHDIRFQLKHGFYYAYAFVSILYILLIRVMPREAREYVSVIILMTDPAVLGFFFIGGIILLEKGQNIFASLFTTPLKAGEYIAAKLLSLTLLSLLSSAAIAFFATPGGFDPGLLILSIVPTSVFFTLLGIVLAVRVKTINGYILASPFFMTPFILPLFGFMKFYSSPVYSLLPGYGSLQLLAGAYYGIGLADAVYSAILILMWDIIAFAWAYRWFKKYIIAAIGGGSI
jgi:fluoroquinolone transport system permease protein